MAERQAICKFEKMSNSLSEFSTSSNSVYLITALLLATHLYQRQNHPYQGLLVVPEISKKSQLETLQKLLFSSADAKI